MSAAISGPNFVDVFSQVIQAQLDNLSEDQKKTLCELVLSKLSPANSPTSPTSSNEMATPQAPPAAQVSQTPVVRTLMLPNAAIVSPEVLAPRGLRQKFRTRFAASKKSVNAFMVFRSKCLLRVTRYYL